VSKVVCLCADVGYDAGSLARDGHGGSPASHKVAACWHLLLAAVSLAYHFRNNRDSVLQNPA
jgi:hypothetical protein